jgi:hypothetical protein
MGSHLQQAAQPDRRRLTSQLTEDDLAYLQNCRAPGIDRPNGHATNTLWLAYGGRFLAGLVLAIIRELRITSLFLCVAHPAAASEPARLSLAGGADVKGRQLPSLAAVTRATCWFRIALSVTDSSSRMRMSRPVP